MRGNLQPQCFTFRGTLSETAKRMLDEFDLDREIARDRPWPKGLSYEQALEEFDKIFAHFLATLKRIKHG